MFAIDINSATWKALTQQLDDEIESLRQRLEKVGTPMSETEALRGEIARCRKVLALAKPPAQEGGESPDYGL